MAYDVPKFTGNLDPIVSTRWLTTVEGAFCTSDCEVRKKVIYATNFLPGSDKMWWEGKVSEKGKSWAEICSLKDFKDLFSAEYALVEEIDRIREEFQSLMQTNETVNELWKKFNDMVPYCSEYHGNEKLKFEIFQRGLLQDDICELISPFKCTTLEDLLSRARVKEAKLMRKKNKEVKESKMKQEYGDRDGKRAKYDHGKRGVGSQTKTLWKKCDKLHYGECRLNMSGRYKCGALNHISRNCTKPMIVCYGCNQTGHMMSECPNPKTIEAKLLKPIKEEKVEVSKPKARVYQMTAKEAKLVPDVVTCIILVNSLPARVLYDLGASVSFISYSFSER